MKTATFGVKATLFSAISVGFCLLALVEAIADDSAKSSAPKSTPDDHKSTPDPDRSRHKTTNVASKRYSSIVRWTV